MAERSTVRTAPARAASSPIRCMARSTTPMATRFLDAATLYEGSSNIPAKSRGSLQDKLFRAILCGIFVVSARGVVDGIDRRIIQVLRTDGRISNADLAAAVGLSASACHRRVRLLEETGVIRGYAAIIGGPAEETGLVVLTQFTLD